MLIVSRHYSRFKIVYLLFQGVYCFLKEHFIRFVLLLIFVLLSDELVEIIGIFLHFFHLLIEQLLLLPNGTTQQKDQLLFLREFSILGAKWTPELLDLQRVELLQLTQLPLHLLVLLAKERYFLLVTSMQTLVLELAWVHHPLQLINSTLVILQVRQWLGLTLEFFRVLLEVGLQKIKLLV